MLKKLKLLSKEFITHDVLHLVLQKPGDLLYHPGQAADISINKKGWEEELRPFTFTSLPAENHLEFTIKIYPEHSGVTNQLRTLVPGDELLLHGVFGTINYRGEGVFIAGGAGVTPFIAILKDLKEKGQLQNNVLVFANKRREDIIMREWFEANLRDHFINVLSEETIPGYAHGFVSKEILNPFLEKMKKQVYLCGPDPMMKAVKELLVGMGVSEGNIVREGF